MIGVGLFSFIAVKKFYFTYLWGQLGAISGMLMMTGIIWAYSKKDWPKSISFLAFFFAVTIITHIPEFIFGGIAVGAIFLIESAVNRKIDFVAAKKVAIAGIIALAITSYYLLVFFYGSYQTQGSNPFVVTP